MKIAVFNPQMGRFFQDVVDEWNKDHDVRYERYYNPELVKWADVVWFFTCDNNISVASHGTDDHPDWNMHTMDLTGKKIIVQPIDIEVWYGHHMGVAWELVTDVVFPAEHIKQLVMKDCDLSNTRIHVAPLGVDIDKFNFVDKPVGKKIAWICEKWPTKGIDYALQIMAILPKDYELHTIGGWNDRYAWEQAYQEDFIKRNDIKFFDYNWIEDQNEWLADKDFILSCSKKEAFGMSIAEGMSKGLIPIIHKFYGCDSLWNINTWDRIDDAVDLIQSPEDDRMQYRDYLINKGYTTQGMLERFNRIING